MRTKNPVEETLTAGQLWLGLRVECAEALERAGQRKGAFDIVERLFTRYRPLLTQAIIMEHSDQSDVIALQHAIAHGVCIRRYGVTGPIYCDDCAPAMSYPEKRQGVIAPFEQCGWCGFRSGKFGKVVSRSW